MVAGRCQEALEALACLHVMAELALLLVEVFPLQTPLLLVVQAARASERQLEHLAVQAARPALRALLVLHLLLVDYSVKVEAAVAVVPLALAVRAVLAVAALAAAVVVPHAVHTPLALVA